MDLDLLSGQYQVRRLEEADLPQVYGLCGGNPLYYRYCPPAVTIDSIRNDMAALPKGKGPEDKYYIGFFKEGMLAAVMDLIFGYPDAKTVMIGFFMMNQKMQGKGAGTSIITEACTCFKNLGFTSVRLGYAKGNAQSEAFWIKNKFKKTGEEIPAEGYVIIPMCRRL